MVVNMSIAKNQKNLKKNKENSLNRFIQFFKNSKKFVIDLFRNLFKISYQEEYKELYSKPDRNLLTFAPLIVSILTRGRNDVNS